MLHAGLDLSRRKVDVCLLSSAGEIVDEWASPPDGDGLRGLAARAAMQGPAVRGVIESMNGARFVHDRLEEHGWDVLIADAQKVKGLAPLACKTDKIDARVLATLSARDLAPEIWLPDPSVRRERELARFRLHLVRHRTTLKNRIHAALIAFGHQCPVSDLFGHAGRELLDRLAIPDPWRRNIEVSLRLIDDLELQIAALTVQLKRPGRRSPLHPAAGHRSGPGVDQRVHRRLGDRRHRPLRLAGPALRLHRPVPSGHPVRRQRPPRPDLQARPQVSALGAVRGRTERLQAPLLRRALPAHQAPPRPPARPQGRPDRSRSPTDRGDLAHAHQQPALRSGRCPVSSSRLTALFGHAPPDEPLRFRQVPADRRGDRDMSTARHHQPGRGPNDPPPTPLTTPPPS
jgi:transposase